MSKHISKLMENSSYGCKAVYEYNRTKDKGEVKFHTKPTQVNRKNPILVIDCYPVVRRWMYELDNGYFVLFSVYDDSRSEAVVADYTFDYDAVYYLDHTMVDIHTKQDLVDFVKEYNKHSNFDMVDIDY
jgi:hypothetical protein|nr:MAG TPA: hypothetical protein [Caudoviricetes sp.]